MLPSRQGPVRAAVALSMVLLAVVVTACSSPPLLPEGADRYETARTFHERGRHEEAGMLLAPLLDDDAVAMTDRAEAAFLSGEAALADGEHLVAYRHYRYVLENAPWSPHAAAIEDRLFELGQIFFHDPRHGGFFGNRTRGVEVFETYQAFFRRSDRADDALRLVGDYFFDDEEWEEAAFTYERLVEEYAESEWVERSLWRAGAARLRLNRGPEYDRDELLRAKERLDLLLSQHPRSADAPTARAELSAVRERLARSELVVADFYRRRGIPDGERVRLANAFLVYADTPSGEEARQRLLAMNIDLSALRSDPSLSSVDAMRPGRRPWMEKR